MRIATWNVERPVGRARRRRIEAKLRSTPADIWVLTETLADLSPAEGFQRVISGASDRPGAAEEAWVAIWSRYPARPVEVFGDRARTAAALIEVQAGHSFVVFGSVLPWRGSPWKELPSAGAKAFEAALSAQENDWGRLKREYGDLCVAGDFNQDLAGKPYYWSTRARTLLEGSVERNDLRCATIDPDPVRRHTSDGKASIDHVCVPKHWSVGASEVWDMGAGRDRLSDHYGVCVTVTSP
jgi:endonuclease/exonuclease/phosphatase family metal-dependent hydrolase